MPARNTRSPGTVEQFNGDYFTNVERVAAAYYGLSDEALLDAAERYGATYVAVKKPHLRPWPVAYENEGYVIYDLESSRGILPRPSLRALESAATT